MLEEILILLVLSHEHSIYLSKYKRENYIYSELYDTGGIRIQLLLQLDRAWRKIFFYNL